MLQTKRMLVLSTLAILIVVGLLVLGFLWYRGVLGSQSQVPREFHSTAKPAPEVFASGASLFSAHCARCHGAAAAGTDQGPSFLSPIYASNHHGDASFFLAVKQGVRAHHWQFGDMPALPDLTPDHVTDIIPYVRWLQEQVGIR